MKSTSLTNSRMQPGKHKKSQRTKRVLSKRDKLINKIDRLEYKERMRRKRERTETYGERLMKFI